MTMPVSPIHGVQLLVVGASVDGMAGAAACLRLLNDSKIRVVFTKAHEVNLIDFRQWPKRCKVGFIDLRVYNEGVFANPKLTINFVKKIYNAGHTILFIANIDGRGPWNDVLMECRHDISELTIQPQDRSSEYTSSCALLQNAFGEIPLDEHTRNLLATGDLGDQTVFTTELGSIFIESVKSKPRHLSRYLYLTRYLAFHTEPNEKIKIWKKEHEQLKENHSKILKTFKDLSNGIGSYDCSVGQYDPKTLFRQAYKWTPIVILTNTRVSIHGTIERGVSIGTNLKDLNFLLILEQANIIASGIACKVTLLLRDKDAAIEAIRNALLISEAANTVL